MSTKKLTVDSHRAFKVSCKKCGAVHNQTTYHWAAHGLNCDEKNYYPIFCCDACSSREIDIVALNGQPDCPWCSGSGQAYGGECVCVKKISK